MLTFSPSLVVVCTSSTCIMSNNNNIIKANTLDQEEKYSEEWTYIINNFRWEVHVIYCPKEETTMDIWDTGNKSKLGLPWERLPWWRRQ